MSIVNTYTPGTFCWVDLMAKDMEDAIGFYRDLFGWTCDQRPAHAEGGPPYGQFGKDGEAVAGIGQMSPEMLAGGMPSVWNSYVSVEDCDATLAKAQTLGAEVVFGTMQTPGGAGWLAYLKDPMGAVFALWQPGEHCGATRVNEPGSFSWNELATTDLTEAQAFYGDLFGWSYETIESPAGVAAAMIRNGDRENGHMIQMNEQWAGIPPHWGVYFAVEDTDATIARITELGGAVMVPPMDIPPGRFSVVADRGGATFTVIKLTYPG